MQAGYFSEGKKFWDDLWWGFETGFLIGWLIMLMAIPFNFISFAWAYRILLGHEKKDGASGVSLIGNGSRVMDKGV